MANLNKTRGKISREKPALQLTSYQLVMAICALLLLMCALFIAGIFVQKFSEGGGTAPLVATNDTPVRPVDMASSAESPPRRTEGTQVAPRPVVLPTDIAKANTTQSRDGKERETGAKYIPAPPPRRDGAKTETPPVASPATPKVDPAPASTTDATAPAAPVTSPAPVQPEPPAVPDPPAQPSTQVAANTQEAPARVEAQTKPVPDAGKGQFTVQVGSFDASNLERAKRFKTETEAKLDIKVNLVPSKDGKHIRAFVGDYADRAAAEKARDAMRKKKGFEDCFVKSLSEE